MVLVLIALLGIGTEKVFQTVNGEGPVIPGLKTPGLEVNIVPFGA
jgi:hypothetical protein